MNVFKIQKVSNPNMINEQIKKALLIISKRLKNTKIRWVIVGSASLALQGVEVKPNDIDILTNKEGAFKINKILKEYEVRPVEFRRSELWESYLGEFNIKGVKVEVMGDLRKVNGELISISEKLSNANFVRLNEEKIPVASLTDQLESYRRIKRKEDLIKVQKIKEKLKKV